MQTPRRFLDFHIDGRSLLEILGSPDAVTLMGWIPHTLQQNELNKLLLLTPSELVEDRRELYVCPECGDLGCGAVTAVVTRRGDHILWTDFAYYIPWSDDGEPQIQREDYEDIGPYAFDAEVYAATLQAAFKMLNEQASNTGEHVN